MSDSGRRTRAQSKAASRESTPARGNPPRRDGRAPSTPATARRTGARANRPVPTIRDGDEELPAVRNKDSKAYGSAGNLKGPVQMDFTQTQKRPELALDTALAQAHAYTSGFLPTLEENPGETQPEPGYQPNAGLQHTSPEIGNPQDGGQGSTIENEGRTHGAVDSSAWAPRSGESIYFALVTAASLFFRILKIILRYVVTEIHGYWLYICDTAMDISTSGPMRFFFWGIVFFSFYHMAQVTHGPLFEYDPPYLRDWRESWQSGNQTTQTNVGSLRIQEIDNRISYVERKIQGFFGTKIAPASPPRINWFEIGQGAVVDPYYSSPSYVPEVEFSLKGFFTSLFALRLDGAYSVSYTQGPAEALKHWNDGGLDRWCAPSSRGKLQLTVNVARPIAPDEIIIEHIEKSATILVGMAPREIELWIEIEDEAAFFEMERAISISYPELLEPSSPEPFKELAPAQALPGTFLPIARFYYDVHSNKAVQNFFVPFNLADRNVKTSRIAIRANSNWGSYDATCINRVRLHAIDMSGVEEELAPPVTEVN